MGSIYEWQPMFSVNHPLLDTQHRQLLALCHRVSVGMSDNGKQSIGDFHLILNDLMVYAREHFWTEERILRNFNYPGLDSQMRVGRES